MNKQEAAVGVACSASKALDNVTSTNNASEARAAEPLPPIQIDAFGNGSPFKFRNRSEPVFSVRNRHKKALLNLIDGSR